MGGSGRVLGAGAGEACCVWSRVEPGPGALSGRIGFGQTSVAFVDQSQSLDAFQLGQQH
jgi:hypothetical protein